ncbi:WGR domain-containing protein [Paenirhodobacter populi]|uniref:WGR domain-containing protein n=1 Tax=Paenirhodobacter populi TaxID=2306993 RepID=A0A443JCV6_9RHOB|nr:WGR domain-containing protein [Sinirhodobacter populi]RWR18314.1 WGR domain-containing protein [Sinirhodobacter populi]
MLSLILHRAPTQGFYRVDLTNNLFGEYSVAREWGRQGRSLGLRIRLYGNLREAAQAADHWRRGAQRRGYSLTEEYVAGPRPS